MITLLIAALLGFVHGTTGVGGAILTVPIFVYLFLMPVTQATAMSLLVVSATSLFSLYHYLKTKNVNFKAVFIFIPIGLTGLAFTRKFLLPTIPDVLFQNDFASLSKNTLLMLLFGLLLLVMGTALIRKKTVESSGVIGYKPSYFRFVVSAFLIGIMSGLFGAGGGFLIIPTLVLVFNMTQKNATGTSLSIVAIQSLLGFLVASHDLNIDWKFLGSYTAVAGLFSVFGSLVANKMNDKTLKKVFSIFIAAIGVFIILKSLLEIFAKA